MRFTDCGFHERVYPDILGDGATDRATALGVWLEGVTVICPDAAWPATGTRVRPVDGAKEKSGI